MKTAISLPNDLFLLAEDFAKTSGMSRSELFATALREYMRARQNTDLTEKINVACAQLNHTLPADLAAMTRRKLLEVEW